MRKQLILNLGILGLLLLIYAQCTEKDNKNVPNDLTWTFTYLKAKAGHKEVLKATVVKNWFAMDSVAKQQGLIRNYELIENISGSDSTEWDFIVAVEYFTVDNYAGIADDFEQIREVHETVKINGLSFGEIGNVVKSEVVKKTQN